MVGGPSKKGRCPQRIDPISRPSPLWVPGHDSYLIGGCGASCAYQYNRTVSTCQAPSFVILTIPQKPNFVKCKFCKTEHKGQIQGGRIVAPFPALGATIRPPPPAPSERREEGGRRGTRRAAAFRRSAPLRGQPDSGRTARHPAPPRRPERPKPPRQRRKRRPAPPTLLGRVAAPFSIRAPLGRTLLPPLPTRGADCLDKGCRYAAPAPEPRGEHTPTSWAAAAPPSRQPRRESRLKEGGGARRRERAGDKGEGVGRKAFERA